MGVLPEVVGAIDGSHIRIITPWTEHKDRYINRKGFHSVVLMAVVGPDMKFIWIHAGYPGAVNDARVYNETLAPMLRANGDELLDGGYLIGDAIFPISPFLISPFKRPQALIPVNRAFNFKHSSQRMVVERTFGLLKGRWRCLMQIGAGREELYSDIITTACILHNIMMDEGHDDVEEVAEEVFDDEEDDPDNGGFPDGGFQDANLTAAGQQRRLEIVQTLDEAGLLRGIH